VLRGCGKQLQVAIINVGSYYLLGVPIGLALVYAADMGALGFWIGCTIGSICQVKCMLVLVLELLDGQIHGLNKKFHQFIWAYHKILRIVHIMLLSIKC